MIPPHMPRPHPPLLNGLRSGAEYPQCQESLQQEIYKRLVAKNPLDCFQLLEEHLRPTAQVSPSPNRGNSGEAFQLFEEDSVAVPQSPHQPDCSGQSDILTESEGGRPVLKSTPCEQGTVEKSPESEPVKTPLLEIQPEAINTRSSICIKGFDNNGFFCYQNSVIQMLCASDSLRVKFIEHLNAMASDSQSINFGGTYPFTVPSCCADEMCLLCALGWVMANHRFRGHEPGPIRVNTTPSNGWICDLRILSSSI